MAEDDFSITGELPLQFSITDEQARELTRLAGTLYDKAEQCAAARNWTAAVIFIGSSVEAALLATLCAFEPELRKMNVWNPQKGDPTNWTLGGMLNVAKRAGWLPITPAVPESDLSSDVSEDDLFKDLSGYVGDAVNFLTAIRNMATHPGAYIREQLRPDFENEEHMRPTYEILLGIHELVLGRLAEQMLTLDAPKE